MCWHSSILARALTTYPRDLNHVGCTPASEDGLKESPKHVRQNLMFVPCIIRGSRNNQQCTNLLHCFIHLCWLLPLSAVVCHFRKLLDPSELRENSDRYGGLSYNHLTTLYDKPTHRPFFKKDLFERYLIHKLRYRKL
jgi:hypothetical protein